MLKAKPLRRKTTLALIVIVFVPLGYFAFMTLFESSLHRKINTLRAAGEPVNVADLKIFQPEPVSPEQNAAAFLERASMELAGISGDLKPVYSVDGFFEGELGASDLATIETALKIYPDLVPLLMQAAQCSGYDPQWDYEADPQAFLEDSRQRLAVVRMATRLLLAHAYWLLAQEQPEAAFASALSLLHLSHHVSHEPTMLGYFVSAVARHRGIIAANRILRSGALPPSAYDALEAELARFDEIESHRRALRIERVFEEGLEDYRPIAAGPLRPFIMEVRSGYLDRIARQLELSAEPYSVVVAAREATPRSESTLQPLSGKNHHALAQLRKVKDRTLALVRCLRILNALERESSRDNVDSARDFAELRLPAEVFIDPYNGEKLQVKQTPDGWLVYSVGENLQDDGGTLTNDLDVGLGPLPNTNQ
jgi:hypothetical protein